MKLALILFIRTIGAKVASRHFQHLIAAYEKGLFVRKPQAKSMTAMSRI